MGSPGMSSSLDILGTGLWFPQTRPVRDIVTEEGGDSSSYGGWENIAVAQHDDHPSTMGARALSQAMNESELDPASIKLVIFAGMSRDYLPSWSVATEIIKLCGLSRAVMGLDLTVGCLGTLAALDMASGWLAAQAGGNVAIVAGERWSSTIDRAQSTNQAMWAYGDGAGAIIVGMGAQKSPPLRFHGAIFTTKSEMNGAVLIKHGGTRFPTADPGEVPGKRTLGNYSREEFRQKYSEGYSRVFGELREKFGVRAKRLICNQITEPTVAMIADLAQIPSEGVVLTGHQIGHVGSVDLIAGLKAVLDEKRKEPVIMGASTPYAFGAGLLGT